MKILFIGVLDVDWSTNIPMKREFQKAGCWVDDFNYRTIAKSFVKNPNSFLGKLCLKLIGNKKMNQELLKRVKKNNYDLVFFAKADSINYRIIPQINKYAKTWYYFMDPMFVVQRIQAHKYAKRCTWASATFSDVNNLFRKHGANSIFLTQGVDTQSFCPQETQKEIDVVFVGSVDKKRKKMMNYLIKNGIKVSCFGHGWGNASIYQEELVEKYRKSKIILNICRKGAGFSIRIFQAMGTGSFMLSEHCPDLEKIFQRKKHLDWFMSKKECLGLIKYYLSHGQEREIIAKQGAGFVSENYSWEEIINKILKTINEKSSCHFSQS